MCPIGLGHPLACPFFFLAPKTILGPIWGPFWLHWAPKAKFGGVKIPKSSTSGSRPRGRRMAMPWPLLAFVVLLGTRMATWVGGWSMGVIHSSKTMTLQNRLQRHVLQFDKILRQHPTNKVLN